MEWLTRTKPVKPFSVTSGVDKATWLNMDMTLSYSTVVLYVIVKALPRVCMKNTARGGVSRG